MTKITVDKALIEQAIEAAFSPYCAQALGILVPALREALTEPAVEPDATCADLDLETREQVVAQLAHLDFYMSPLREPSPTPPAEVLLLDDLAILRMWHETSSRVPMCNHYNHFARAIEQAVRQKAGLV